MWWCAKYGIPIANLSTVHVRRHCHVGGKGGDAGDELASPTYSALTVTKRFGGRYTPQGRKDVVTRPYNLLCVIMPLLSG